jgi:peptidoglycan/LPS O-acetylase OafA/YrhL
MLIYRCNWIIKNKMGFIGMAVLLTFAFVMPFSKWNWLTEPIVVLLYFPLIVALGAGAQLTQGVRKLCIFSGKISYPLYMTHYAVLWIFGNYNTTHKPGTTEFSIVVITSIILVVGFAWLVMTFYDTPVRKYFSDRRKRAKA